MKFPILSSAELVLIIIAALGIISAAIPTFVQLIHYLGDKPERKVKADAAMADTESVRASTADKLVSAAEKIMNIVEAQQAGMADNLSEIRQKVDETKLDSANQLKAMVDANAAQIKLIKEASEANQKTHEAEATELKNQVVGLKEQVATLLKVNAELRKQVDELGTHGKVLEEAAKVQSKLMPQFAAMQETLNKVMSGVTDVKDEQKDVAAKKKNGD